MTLGPVGAQTPVATPGMLAGSHEQKPRDPVYPRQLGLCDLPVELVQHAARFLRAGDGTLHQSSYLMSPLTAVERNAAHERGIANMLDLALVNKWLYAALRPVYWEQPIQPAGLDTKALKRLYSIKPSIMPYIQALDIRDGQPHGDSIRRRTSARADLRFEAPIVLARLAKLMPGLRSLSVNAVTQLPIHYGCWPALAHLSLNFQSFPNSQAVLALLTCVPEIRSLEFTREYNNRRTPRQDKDENFGHELRVFGQPLPDLQPWDYSIEPAISLQDQDENEDEEQDSDQDSDSEDDMRPAPNHCTLFATLQRMQKLEHLALMSDTYLRSAHWPSQWTSPPCLRALTLTCSTGYEQLRIIIERFGDVLESLSLCIFSGDGSYWYAQESGLALPVCTRLHELELIQYGGQRIYGPTLHLFRRQVSLVSVRIIYRSGFVKYNSGQDVEDAPDLEELQQLAIEPDNLPALRRLVVRNLRPFQFELPFEALFEPSPEIIESDAVPAMGDDISRQEMRQIYQQCLISEGWPLVRCQKALREDRDLDEARQWLIENLETEGIDDNESSDTMLTEADVRDQGMEQIIDLGSDDAQFAADLQRQEDETERTEQLAKIKKLSRTIHIVEQLRILFASREPPISFFCWPEGRDSDEAD